MIFDARFGPRGLIKPAAVACFSIAAMGAAQSPSVAVERAPNGGIQPQAARGSDGALHVLYFKGDARAGDLFYVRRESGEARFSAPLRVNSEPGSAVAAGTIRGGQLALGKGDRPHVAWNGSQQAARGDLHNAPFLYARSNDEGSAFEPQRNLITWASGIDGGGAIAADAAGNVYATWHAMAGASDEAGRAIYLARSTDGGSTFAREIKASPDASGACGCCGMAATLDAQGRLFAAYRAAAANTERDAVLLMSSDAGASFDSARVHPWHLSACPMSSFSFASNGNDRFLAWETEDRIFFGRIETVGALNVPAPMRLPGGGAAKLKHPAIAVKDGGEILIAWLETRGWGGEGRLFHQVFDAEGRAIAKPTLADAAAPAWTKPSALARPDGSFLILY
jgi:hypothetical protein